MYSIGEIVVYRHHVCEIMGVRAAYFEGEDYLELRALFNKTLKLFVKTSEARPPMLRAVMTEEEAFGLIDSIASADPIDEGKFASSANAPTLTERLIREEYERCLGMFSPESLVPIIKTVHVRTTEREACGRRITATDKKYFDLAEKLLCDELSISLKISRDEVKDFLIDQIKRAERKRFDSR